MAYTDIARKIDCMVVAYDGNTYNYYYNTDEVIELTLDRNAEGKFFGVSVAQKLTVKLRNIDNEIALKNGDSLDAYLYQGTLQSYGAYLGRFYITNVEKDENTNALTIIGYDPIYFLAEHTLEEVETNYNSISSLLDAILEVYTKIPSWDYTSRVEDVSAFTFTYSGDNIINFDGTETLRDVLTRICEATQTIAYMLDDELTFTRLNPEEEVDFTIPRSQYFTLKNKDIKTLTGIVATTELGDNVGVEDQGVKDITQYINENGFLNHISDTDLNTKINSAFALMDGLEINQFEMNWRGNPLIDYAAKIKIEDKDGNYIYTYLLDDTLKYNGGLSQNSKWSYTDAQTTEYNPTSIGSALTRATAKVDKVNNRIDLEVQEINDTFEQKDVALEITLDGIRNSVNATTTDIEQINQVLEGLDDIREDIGELRTSNSMLITNYGTIFETTQALLGESGKANYVSTNTTTIDANGITVQKNNTSIQTNINEDGMTIYDGEAIAANELLKANSQGVIAKDLTAKNYLIIDGLIRFQKYGSNRVGCYWIGG